MPGQENDGRLGLPLTAMEPPQASFPVVVHQAAVGRGRGDGRAETIGPPAPAVAQQPAEVPPLTSGPTVG